VSYLLAPEEVRLGEIFFRAHSSKSAKDDGKVKAEALEWIERYIQIEKIIGRKEEGNRSFAQKKVTTQEEAEKLAIKIRGEWALGEYSIANVTEVLEEKGIKVLLTDLPSKISGLTCVARLANGEVPIVLINKSFSLERRRFTLAHELGHQLIAGEGREVEQLCNRFAGALLVPKSHLLSEVGKKRTALGHQEIIDLKKLYGVSASALLVRLEQIGVITKQTLEYAFRTFAKSWRTKEPEELEDSDRRGQEEQPKRFERLVYRALAEEYISRSKAAELLRVPVSVVEHGMKGQ
jgi:Zn-dependent peptidase ImmA (M78 family)